MTASEAVPNAEYVHKYSAGKFVFISKRPESESHGNFWSVKEKRVYPLAYSLMTRAV